MIVLGLNGSGARGDHDAAACLLIDGRIAAFVEEERFTRRKHAWHCAAHSAAAACMAMAGVELDDVDTVAYGWDLPLRLSLQGKATPATDDDALELVLPRSLFPRRRNPAIQFVPHHLAHAASAFLLSGADSGPVIVIDGQGERASISVAVGKGHEITILDTWPIAASLGYFYEAACEYAGLGYAHAGKLMGLAAHGTPAIGLFDIADEADATYRLRAGVGPQHLESDDSIVFPTEIQNAWLRYFAKVWRQPPNQWRHRFDALTGTLVTEPTHDPFDYRDFAATVQHTIEALALRIVSDVLRRVDGDVLHLAGGVGYNASLNGAILTELRGRQLFVQPIAGDAGVALGAAAFAAVNAGDRMMPMPADLGLGRTYSPPEILEVLDRTGLAHEAPDDLSARVASLIARGRVVGWFQGGSEVGPRALGHRSILASPGSTALRDRVNLQMKQREWWRPFAPSIREDAFATFIDSPAAALSYMVVTAQVPQARQTRLQGVTHVDGSTRPQTVIRAANAQYAELLDDVETATGVPVVLNTSFNGRGEPLVETPAQAVTAFVLNGLDALAIGPYLLTATRA